MISKSIEEDVVIESDYITYKEINIISFSKLTAFERYTKILMDGGFKRMRIALGEDLFGQTDKN